SLIDLLLNLLRDPQALAAYQNNPQGFLSSCGSNVSPADIHDALVLLQDSQDADSNGTQHTGATHLADHVQVPTPPAYDGHTGGSDHEAAVRYLNTYITNNNIDDRHTTVDNSIHQQVDTHGGNFDQDIDVHSTVASGDGAVAAGGDIEGSTVVTGHDNQVGDNNVRGDGNVVGDNNDVISGHDNTAAFGNGDANSASFDHVNVSDGGALAVGGNADGSNHVDGSFNTTETTTTNSTDYHDSFNQDNDTTDHSFNDTSSDVHSDSHDQTHNDTLSHNVDVVH
ncbi:MAG: hypothetical protein JWR58_6163, partial [Pseudonocardia sp.]|nr:hypothetical protein [Pseudonocardia sp.]